MKYYNLDTPSLLVDEQILKANLKRMQQYADLHHVLLRPHTKTHKTPRIAIMQLEYGACGIAVAKVGEAEVMASDGIKDIFIANQVVGRIKLERIRELSKSIIISFGADCPEHIYQAQEVFSETGSVAEILIEVEVGEVRSGINTQQDLLAILSAFRTCPNTHFKGLYSHDGNSYHAKDFNELMDISCGAQKRTLDFASICEKEGFKCEVISYGATPTFMNNVPILNGITELRPGTYALMDASQGNAIGSQKSSAATVLATVISKSAPSRVVLDVGAKGLTMQERKGGICEVKGKGLICEANGKDLITEYPGVYISRMFDEHAIIENSDFYKIANIGDKVRIIPVHICPVCNLYDTMYLISNDEVLSEMKIEARGKQR